MGEVHIESLLDHDLFAHDELKELDDSLLAVAGGVKFPPEVDAGGLDLLGVFDFLLASEKGDAGHLAEIHPDRVAQLADRGRLIVFFFLSEKALFQDLDALFFESLANAGEIGSIRVSVRCKLEDVFVAYYSLALEILDKACDYGFNWLQGANSCFFAVSGVFLIEAFPHRDIKQTSGQT